MAQENRLSFTIRRPDGTTHELSIDSERALIGSDAHCEIRLPREHCQPEVLLLEQRDSKLFCEVRSFAPPPTVNGQPFGGGPLPDGAIIGVGGFQLAPRLASSTGRAGDGDDASSKSNPAVTVAAVLLLIAAAGMFLSDLGAEEGLPEAPAATALWSEKAAAVSCEQSDASRARALAVEQQLLAEGRRERAPFFSQDGVIAVGLFETSAACFSKSGDEAMAKQLSGAAADLREKLRSDFHVHQVRLERALATNAYDVARQEAQILLGFLRGKNDEYVTWLSSLDRTLELKFSGKKTQ